VKSVTARRVAAALTLAAALQYRLPSGAVPGAELESSLETTLDLFQRIARSDLVVHVKTHDGTLRYAAVDVLDTLKGAAPAPRLRIAFRDFNLQRPAGVKPIIFPNGQEEILFLVAPALPARRKLKDQDLFILLRGADGRISLPAEGSGETLEAVRQLASLTDRDPTSQIEGLTRMFDGTNLILIEAALDEIGRLHAATPKYYGRLMQLLSNPSPGLRSRALHLIGSTFPALEEGLDDSTLVDQRDAILAAVLERARNDPDNNVRAAAVAAVGAWPNPRDVESELRAIAAQDPAQAVRYEAERALFRSHPR